ncbi:hypothetical protein 2050HW_00130 [Serratia phage vB_SmaM_ 2050HW]|uniref:Uncharacterized protein n=1 Tax=Serratia phage vB_SmaM_ 2050HW TaxID=2024252 RepID=A0A289Z7C8_9CAUD|nr:hypothetical protein HWB23_gp130 [Serratia phage vB_SmaM_ 2050HW]ATA65465.1 hypothetical protein 2050HW_00130 [Serratia phage vB_SmaM_ 2050HW]UCR74731.1 hypothetical protein [Serratia phage BUCT660]UQT03598.1 hypothetical protein KODAMA_01310 [Serratia phage vB_SmaM-Kodama]URG13991.1 hypothetical protein [Pectobacterium phage vB_ParM-25]
MSTIINTPNNKTVSNRFFYYTVAAFAVFATIVGISENDTVNLIAWVVLMVVNVNLAHCDNEEVKAAGYKPTTVWLNMLLSPIGWGIVRVIRTRNGGFHNFKGIIGYVVGVLAVLMVLGLATEPNEDEAIATRTCEIINEQTEPFFLEGVKCDHAEFDSKPGKYTWVINVYKTDGDVTMVNARYDAKNDMITVF